MFKYFYPDLYIRDVFSLPYNRLKKQGISTLLFDIDNTLAPFDRPRPSEDVIAFLEDLTKKGFKICIYSNAGKRRVSEFMRTLTYKYVYNAGKPFGYGLNRALRLVSADKNSAAIVGDQIFTDILAGKINKVYTVLVKPMTVRDEFFVGLKRRPERVVINEYKKFRRIRACSF